MWYYVVGEERRGPVTREEICDLAASGIVHRETLVWRDGMPAWEQAQATELAALVTPVPTPMRYVEGRTDAAARQRWLESVPTGDPAAFARLYLLWCVAFALGGALSVCATSVGAVGILAYISYLGFAQLPADGAGPAIAAIAIVLICVAAIGCLLVWMELMFQCWRQVDDGSARITPGLAVGLSCIPCFNAFWCFIAVYGLAVEMNRVMDENVISGGRPSRSLALAYCIANVGAIVPCVYMLAIPVAIVLAFFVYHDLQCGGAQILAWRLARSRGARSALPAAPVV
jgi:hypothetical protein